MKKAMIEKALELINQDMKMSTLGLVDEDGYPFVSATLAFKNTGLKEFWISTGLDSKKVACINNNNKAGICYYNDRINFTASGTAEVITDTQIKEDMWEEWMLNYYDSPTLELYCLIKVTVNNVRIFMNGENIDLAIDDIKETA